MDLQLFKVSADAPHARKPAAKDLEKPQLQRPGVPLFDCPLGAQALGIREDDVDRLIHEARLERRHKRGPK